ncbi:MAG: class I SAM-dependent methyltransferase [Verrucomicrobia bacterium]|nr:class I SAM-dependent methyltransferase [Verrucomicrobiota bacterium]
MQFKGNTDDGSARYWDDLAELYQKETRISTRDFHYGPLLPGDSTLQLLPMVGKNDPGSFQCLENNMGGGSASFQCLEIGCGAGQNSIFLAKQGAQCVATDISEEQLAHGRKLAEAEGVEVDFQRISMDSMDHLGSFDLIHSTYALPFSSDPARVIAEAAAMLKPGGTFLLTTGHPLYAGEWLEIGDDEDGVFLPDYFEPEADVRMALNDGAISAARYWPISQVAEWIHDAGLIMERVLEPAPMPIPDMSEEEILASVPYESADWRTLYSRLARIPVVVIFKCRRA